MCRRTGPRLGDARRSSGPPGSRRRMTRQIRPWRCAAQSSWPWQRARRTARLPLGDPARTRSLGRTTTGWSPGRGTESCRSGRTSKSPEETRIGHGMGRIASANQHPINIAIERSAHAMQGTGTELGGGGGQHLSPSQQHAGRRPRDHHPCRLAEVHPGACGCVVPAGVEQAVPQCV